MVLILLYTYTWLSCKQQGRIQSFERGGALFWNTVEDQKKLAENQLKTKKKKKKKKVTTIIASYPYQLYHICYVK